MHGASAASDFYGECSSLVSVPKVVSAIDSFNFVLATAASALLFHFALDICPRKFIERLKEFEFGYKALTTQRLNQDYAKMSGTQGAVLLYKNIEFLLFIVSICQSFMVHTVVCLCMTTT